MRKPGVITVEAVLLAAVSATMGLTGYASLAQSVQCDDGSKHS